MYVGLGATAGVVVLLILVVIAVCKSKGLNLRKQEVRNN